MKHNSSAYLKHIPVCKTALNYTF